jgi:hypothetical protein
MGFQPLAAIVAKVIDDQTVNLSVIDESGDHSGKLRVTLIQNPDANPLADPARCFATWMPYQKAQAEKPLPHVLTVAEVQKIVSEMFYARDIGGNANAEKDLEKALRADTEAKVRAAVDAPPEPAKALPSVQPGPPKGSGLDLTAIAKGK